MIADDCSIKSARIWTFCLPLDHWPNRVATVLFGQCCTLMMHYGWQAERREAKEEAWLSLTLGWCSFLGLRRQCEEN